MNHAEEYETLNQMYQAFQVSLAEAMKQPLQIHPGLKNSRYVDFFGIEFNQGDISYVLSIPLDKIVLNDKLGGFLDISGHDRHKASDMAENIRIENEEKATGQVTISRESVIRRAYSLPDRLFLFTEKRETSETSLETIATVSLVLPDDTTYYSTTGKVQTKAKEMHQLEMYLRDPETKDEYFITTNTHGIPEEQKGCFGLTHDKKGFNVLDERGKIEAIVSINGKTLRLPEQRKEFVQGVVRANDNLCAKKQEGAPIFS